MKEGGDIWGVSAGGNWEEGESGDWEDYLVWG